MKILLRTLGSAFLGWLLTFSLAAQTPQGGAHQPDVKAKPAEKPPVGAKTAEVTKPDSGMSKPAPEMERVLQQFQGRWNTEEKHEPSEMMPQGGTGKGQEGIRPGPGKMSMIGEYSSQGPMGEFAGIGIMTWDPTARVYHLYWTDNTNPAMTISTGRWEGRDLVFTGVDTLGGKKSYSRHTFTDLTPNAFTYTLDLGPSTTQLKRTATIKYTRVNPRDYLSPGPR